MESLEISALKTSCVDRITRMKRARKFRLNALKILTLANGRKMMKKMICPKRKIEKRKKIEKN